MTRLLVLGFILGACASEGPALTGHVSEKLRACAAVESPDVRSVEDAVDRINALPEPADVPCFVASLARPLDVVLSSNVLSAQPAGGPDSPRLFFLSDSLVISVVPDGEGAPLVEFGEWTSPTSNIKSEVSLPAKRPMAQSEPYDRVRFEGGGTTCGFCHRDEIADPLIPGAFDSAALKPAPRDLVPLRRLLEEHDTCVEADDQSARCEMLHAIVDFGELTPGAFGEEVYVFGQTVAE